MKINFIFFVYFTVLLSTPMVHASDKCSGVFNGVVDSAKLIGSTDHNLWLNYFSRAAQDFKIEDFTSQVVTLVDRNSTGIDALISFILPRLREFKAAGFEHIWLDSFLYDHEDIFREHDISEFSLMSHEFWNTAPGSYEQGWWMGVTRPWFYSYLLDAARSAGIQLHGLAMDRTGNDPASAFEQHEAKVAKHIANLATHSTGRHLVLEHHNDYVGSMLGSKDPQWRAYLPIHSILRQKTIETRTFAISVRFADTPKLNDHWRSPYTDDDDEHLNAFSIYKLLLELDRTQENTLIPLDANHFDFSGYLSLIAERP